MPRNVFKRSGEIMSKTLVEKIEELGTDWSKVNTALHHLWSKNVGTDNYDKEEWKLLEKYIYKIILKDRG